MPNYTPNKQLELPISSEKYSVAVANKNNTVIDSELNKIDIKLKSHDETLAKQASTTQIGLTQLEDSVNSTSINKAATPNSVKQAYDLAYAAFNMEEITTSQIDELFEK